MKKAIIALDGGGSNLRVVVVDRFTGDKIYYDEVATGTNLTTVADKAEAIDNLKRLIQDGIKNMPEGYEVQGIGLSSAGTEIKENVDELSKALNEVVSVIVGNKPELFITNDIDILLHSSDIALVAGTGTVAAVRYKDIKPYDNISIDEETIDKYDGDGQFIGDKGSGYWIATQALTKIGQIEKTGYYLNHKNEIVKADSECLLREMVLEKLLGSLGYSDEIIQNVLNTSLKRQGLPDYIAIVYKATEEEGKVYDRAKVGSMFGAMVEKAAKMGDTVANEILLEASQELFLNIVAAYENGGFANTKPCDILLSGSVLTKGEIVKYNLERKIKERYPYGVYVKENTDEPVMATVKYVKKRLIEKEERNIER